MPVSSELSRKATWGHITRAPMCVKHKIAYLKLLFDKRAMLAPTVKVAPLILMLPFFAAHNVQQAVRRRLVLGWRRMKRNGADKAVV